MIQEDYPIWPSIGQETARLAQANGLAVSHQSYGANGFVAQLFDPTERPKDGLIGAVFVCLTKGDIRRGDHMRVLARRFAHAQKQLLLVNDAQ